MAAKAMDVSDVADEAEPPALLDLLPELLTLVVSKLTPQALLAAMRTCKLLQQLTSCDDVWAAMLARFFPDVEWEWPQNYLLQCLPKPDPAQRPIDAFRDLTRHSPVHRCAWCKGSMLLPDEQRCPCVAKRTNRLSLRLGGLSIARAGESCLAGGGFTELHVCLRRHFDFDFVEMIDTLDRSSLEGLDVLILCTTEGPALSAEELFTLRAWIRSGGALIVSAFSSWSTHGHFAASTVGFLGLRTVAQTRSLPALTHSVDPSTPVDDCTRRLVDDGPFGAVTTFRNACESLFRVLPAAFADGAVQLVTCSGRRNLLHDGVASLLFYPPSTAEEGGRDSGVTGRGRVLVCSNYHWLCDASYWNGGTFSNGEDQKALLLNFIAGALAARVGKVGER